MAYGRCFGVPLRDHAGKMYDEIVYVTIANDIIISL